jgi:DNA-binding IclR family transcriptional regulator
MDDELVKKVGDLPRGRGILGLLISEPVPIRLADLAAAAGRAITNARRFTESKQRRRWLAASSDLTPLLLSAGVQSRTC